MPNCHNFALKRDFSRKNKALFMSSKKTFASHWRPPNGKQNPQASMRRTKPQSPKVNIDWLGLRKYYNAIAAAGWGCHQRFRPGSVQSEMRPIDAVVLHFAEIRFFFLFVPQRHRTWGGRKTFPFLSHSLKTRNETWKICIVSNELESWVRWFRCLLVEFTRLQSGFLLRPFSFFFLFCRMKCNWFFLVFFKSCWFVNLTQK